MYRDYMRGTGFNLKWDITALEIEEFYLRVVVSKVINDFWRQVSILSTLNVLNSQSRGLGHEQSFGHSPLIKEHRTVTLVAY
jgi:hypothetical protein